MKNHKEIYEIIVESVLYALKNSSIGKKHKEHLTINQSSEETESNVLLSEFHDTEFSFKVEDMEEE